VARRGAGHDSASSSIVMVSRRPMIPDTSTSGVARSTAARPGPARRRRRRHGKDLGAEASALFAVFAAPGGISSFALVPEHEHGRLPGEIRARGRPQVEGLRRRSPADADSSCRRSDRRGRRGALRDSRSWSLREDQVHRGRKVVGPGDPGRRGPGRRAKARSEASRPFPSPRGLPIPHEEGAGEVVDSSRAARGAYGGAVAARHLNPGRAGSAARRRNDPERNPRSRRARGRSPPR